MPSMSNLKQINPVKMLLIGDSGSGKTGALASLAEAGYKIRILDFDNGVNILANLLADKPQALANIIYETCTDARKAIGGRIMIEGQPKAASKAMNLLTHWKTPEVKDANGTVIEPASDLGPISSWGRDTIVVIDSLTFLGQALMNHVLAMQGRMGAQPQIQDWGEAQRMQRSILELLYSDAVKCNVIVISHIKYIGDETNDANLRGYPAALGQALAPEVGRYFNTTVMAKTKGTGTNRKRVIYTVTEGKVELKTENPNKIPAELPLETGMADLFKILLPKA